MPQTSPMNWFILSISFILIKNSLNKSIYLMSKSSSDVKLKSSCSSFKW